MWIFPYLKVAWLVHFSCSFIVLSECALSVFQPILLLCGCFHVAVFKSPLILAPSSVSWCNYIVESFGEIVQLDTKVRHPILKLYIRWIWALFPNLFFLPLTVDHRYLIVPVSFDVKVDLFALTIHFISLPYDLESFVAKPTSPLILNFALFVWSFQVDDIAVAA